MANSLITKRMLAQSLKELVREIPLEKITIADICGKHNMNRKSFYYHFKDKYDLLKYIFQMEFLATCPIDTPHSRDFFLQLYQYLYDNQEFYRHVFRPHQHNYFLLYFHEIIRQHIEQIMVQLMDGDTQSEFETLFLTDGFTYSIKRWITDYRPILPEEIDRKMIFLLENIARKLKQG